MDYRTRSQWGASYDVNQRATMTGLPVATIYIHHTVTNPSNDPNRDMAQIEQIDIGRFGIPSYSWVVHPSGVVLEGMGVHRGAHTINNANQSQNNIAFGISNIGNYENDQPTDAQLKAIAELIHYINDNGWLQADWQLRGHRDVYATACPGANLYPRLGDIRALYDNPTPNPQPVQEDDEMQFIVKGDKTNQWWLTDFKTKTYVPTTDFAGAVIWLTAVAGGKIGHDGKNGPISVAQAVIDAVPQNK